jgi:2-polyprenyl-6-methoxyphenol hydroxylase-like FAD-dependent oxidoreductase
MNAIDTDIVIVGAGPTGLTLAGALEQRGIRTVVLDRQHEGSNTSRAAVVHSRTLEMLERLGVVERLVGRGVRAARFSIRDRDRVLVPIQFDQLPTRYPFTLMISQAATEAVLRERLAEVGGRVLWCRTVVGMEQDEGGATATLEGGTRVRGRYLVGADGMHSIVRETLGVEFPGAQYPQSFSLADVRLAGEIPRDEVQLYFSPEGFLVVAPLPDQLYRIVATVDSAPAEPDGAFIQALLDSRGPARERAVVQQVLWGSRFHVHNRLARTYRKGRVLLAGDAAHVHSPAGGQGMNTGIQDAVVLADALTRAVRGNDEHGLDEYERERKAVAGDVMRLADRLTRLATASRGLRALRNVALSTLSRLPGFRRRLAWQLSGLAHRPPGASAPATSRPIPRPGTPRPYDFGRGA